MPIYAIKLMENLAKICGTAITDRLRARLAKLPPEDKAAGPPFGIDYATDQCNELLAHRIAGLHFYTLNKSPATREIARRLGFS